MATYKVIQDIEAEDKFVGPLTLKQFIFAMGGAFFGWLSVIIGLKAPFMLLIFVPPSLLGFFMAIPWSKDQPTEIWVLAKLRFHFKPKKRLWDQSGLQELVTITAPKKIEKALTKNFSQSEVKSRLKALAETIDSRGWAIKNADQPGGVDNYSATSDRLINSSQLVQNVPEQAADDIPDMLDENGSGTSANFDQMIEEKDQERRSNLVNKMDRIRNGEPLESIDETPRNITAPSEVLPHMKPYNPTMDEQLLVKELQAKKKSAKLSQKHLHSIPTSRKTDEEASSSTQTTDNNEQPQDINSTSAQDNITTMTTSVRPDIIDLARNNDLNVATIARQAQQNDDNEVVVSLH